MHMPCMAARKAAGICNRTDKRSSSEISKVVNLLLTLLNATAASASEELS